MIEANIYQQTLSEALAVVPQNDCGCTEEWLFEGFMRDFDNWQAFTDFEESWQAASSDNWNYEDCVEAFRDTAEFEQLWDNYYERHLDDCEGFVAGDEFWTYIRRHLAEACAWNGRTSLNVRVDTHLCERCGIQLKPTDDSYCWA